MITIHLDTNSVTPLYQQLYSYIKSEIQSGSLPYGTKLPSSRNLASHLQVSRNTVDTAYSQLVSEGYLEAKAKRGYFVNQISGLLYLSPKTTQNNKIKTKIEPVFDYDFSPFSIDLSHFPYDIWKQLSKSIITKEENLFLSGNQQGDFSLRFAITNYLHQSRNVSCTPEQIIIGAGVDYLLQLLMQFFPSDTVIAMENPTYKKAFHIFNGIGKSTIDIPLDKSGLDVSVLSNKNASLVYVTPSHQFPLGIVMPIKRRIELLKWASKDDKRYIIEDDYDSEFRYVGKPIPCLQGIDHKQKVIYIGTFSRSIAPSIRVGYMVLPLPLLQQYRTSFPYYSCTVSRLEQATITAFIEKGYFERHLNRMRKVYKNKHDTIVQSLKIFKEHITIIGENAGLHVVVKFNLSIEETLLIPLAEKSGIKLYSLYDYYISPPKNYSPTLLMGYATLSEEKIRTGIEKLYYLIKPFLNP